MPRHVVVDGSNLATEGRPHPSLAQLNEAVLAYIAEHPEALITVVVDATFGHRIDPKELPEFDEAVANNELVAPPAGAIGRGDAFVLAVANRVNAVVLSNDSFQEFHGQYAWLFDEGRLVGGKPVPHVGWVFVERLPVRGPISRSAVKKARGGRPAADSGTVRVGSADASQPMPVPKAPPPGRARSRRPGRGAEQAAPAPAPAVVEAAAAPMPAATPSLAAAPAATPTARGAANPVNEPAPFLAFVAQHPLGTSVNAVVESYSSHGAYVRIGEVRGYVPLRLMSDPAPRSAREFMKIGDAVTLAVESYAPERRSIDLATPAMASHQSPAGVSVDAAVEGAVAGTAAPAAEEATKPVKRSRAKKAAAAAPAAVEMAAAAEAPAVGEAAKPVKRSRAKKAAPAAVEVAAVAEAPAVGEAAKPVKRSRAKKAAPAAVEVAAVAEAPAVEEAAKPVKRSRAKKAAAPAPVEAPADPAPRRRRSR